MIDLAGLAEQLRRVTVELTHSAEAIGCGVLWPRGCVVTNAHVVQRPTVTVGLVDGRRLQGHVVARDPRLDLALLRVDGAGIPTATIALPTATIALPTTTIAGPDTPRVGSLVVALGHPLGVRGALTAGIIHAIGPVVPGGRTWIQADVRLAPGNSGGPLADASGRVVGLNAMIAGGLALAVPMSQVARFVRKAGMRVAGTGA